MYEVEVKMKEVMLAQNLFHKNNKHRFQINRKCSGCSRKVSTGDVKFIGENNMGVWFNCNHCNSTMILKAKRRFKGIRQAGNAGLMVFEGTRTGRFNCSQPNASVQPK